MQKPSAKWVIIFNIVLDLPMAIIMAVSAALLSHQPLVLVPNLLSNIVIAFCLAFLINVILPIPLISAKFAGLFGIKPHTLGESLVGGIPVCLIFNVGIGLPLTIFNLAMAHQLKMLWPAFLPEKATSQMNAPSIGPMMMPSGAKNSPTNTPASAPLEAYLLPPDALVR